MDVGRIAIPSIDGDIDVPEEYSLQSQPDEAEAAPAAETSNHSAHDSTSLRCKICLDDTEPLSRFCQCSGSIGLAHQECLQTWIEQRESESNKCEICKCDFNMRATTKARYCVCSEFAQLPFSQIIAVMLNFIIPVVYFYISWDTYGNLYWLIVACVFLVFALIEYTLIARFCFKFTKVT